MKSTSSSSRTTQRKEGKEQQGDDNEEKQPSPSESLGRQSHLPGPVVRRQLLALLETKLRVSQAALCAVFVVGSRLWRCARHDSDWDLVVVVKGSRAKEAKGLAGKGQMSVDVTLMGEIEWRVAAVEMELLPTLLLALPHTHAANLLGQSGSLPPALDAVKLAAGVRARVAKDFVKGAKFLGKGNVYAGKKIFSHALRQLMLATCIIRVYRSQLMNGGGGRREKAAGKGGGGKKCGVSCQSGKGPRKTKPKQGKETQPEGNKGESTKRQTKPRSQGGVCVQAEEGQDQVEWNGKGECDDSEGSDGRNGGFVDLSCANDVCARVMQQPGESWEVMKGFLEPVRSELLDSMEKALLT